MEKQNLINFLSKNLDFNEDKISLLLEDCQVKNLKKHEFLLQESEFCQFTFFVEKGLLRQYSIDEKGKEHTILFAPENWLVSDRESVYFNQPSSYFIQAQEESDVVMIGNNFFEILSEKIPEFTSFNNKLLHNHIRHLQNRINMLLSASAEDRYLQFIEMYPDILLRVPQIMVASYLGITPESLSRVRKELAKKNFKN
ncbi:MAG: Crp/Fnr family transcriptional regulator [Psychroflexus sp.]|uniref:Crp/Fnr family transcriptional regulator n=1 Tax=Psychroflexus sp. S27 TaxID=1982757 RepID=UPI000C2A612C|nr:Crp/Fnr family transcriptional regulator [Psychroflexus sp. S27]PJX21785.1 cyclic nucleotide-binding protein [Psychroflexus sp. S27]